MSLQTIIDNATFLTINKRKGAGVTVSRSGHIKTSVQQGSLYRFTVGAPQGFKYSDNRGVLEDLDTQDVTVEANVSLNNNSGMNYITDYKGSLSSSQLDQVTLVGTSGSEIYVSTSSVSGNVSGYTNLIKKGDFIQPEGNTSTYRYPYQVTSDVAWSSSSNITIPVHRPILSQDGVALTSGNLRFGTEVRFHCVVPNMPTYSVVPHDLIEFSDDFELIERIT